MDQNMKKQLTDTNKWLRLLFMVLFGLALNFVIQFVIYGLALIQFVVILFSGNKNQMIADFSDSFAQYSTQVIQYLLYTSETKPFPFGPWPKKQ